MVSLVTSFADFEKEKSMNSQLTTGVLLCFAGWIVVAFALAERRLKNAYSKYQKED